MLSNGEKTDNKQIGRCIYNSRKFYLTASFLEGLLLRDQNISHVQVFGAGRMLNGVILGPSNPLQSTPDFLSQIQPTIDHANSVLPHHSRLVPELIIVAQHDKPFATTDKGTVKAKETLSIFETEITNSYVTLEGGGEWVFDGSVTNPHDIREFLRKAMKGLLDKDFADTADLFEQGGHISTSP